MKSFDCDKIKNVGLVGHSGAGKTSLSEALLFNCGIVSRIGKVADGNTVSDYDPEEIKRKISIHATLLPIEYQNYKINFIDTPGYTDFSGETISAMRIVDSAILVFDAVSGFGVGTGTAWKYAEKFKLPIIGFLNRIDKDRADFAGKIESVRANFGAKVVPIHIPIGVESNFKGIVDIVKHKAFVINGDKLVESEIPPDLNDDVAKYKEMMLEALAEIDDTLLEEYLDNKEISDEEISSVLKRGIVERKVVPVLCGSAVKNIGIDLLLKAILNWLPSPCEKDIEGVDPSSKAPITRKPSKDTGFSALVFKTVIEPHLGELSYARIYSGTVSSGQNVTNSTKNTSERIGQITITRGKTREDLPIGVTGDIVVFPKLKAVKTGDTLCNSNQHIMFPATEYPSPSVRLAVKPKSKQDQEKLSLGLSSFTKEDPTFNMVYNPETKETIISGMGDVHLEIILKKLKERFAIEIETSPPRIPYKETIHSKAKAQGKYKKQTGGHGQYGDAWIEIDPLPRGRGFEFVDKIVGGAIPRNYIPSVEKGIREAMDKGVIAGYPVIDVKVTLFDGSYHDVDSSDLAFKIAASMGFKAAFQEAKPVLLEPIMNIEVQTPPQYVGEVVSDINKRRGHVSSIESARVLATVPMAELQSYATDLRSFTHGTGSFTTTFSRYQEVLPKTQEDLCKKYQLEREKGGEV